MKKLTYLAMMLLTSVTLMSFSCSKNSDDDPIPPVGITVQDLAGDWNFVNLTDANGVHTDSTYLYDNYGASGKINITVQGSEILFDYLNHSESGTGFFDFTLSNDIVTIPGMNNFKLEAKFDGNDLLLTDKNSFPETITYRLR